MKRFDLALDPFWPADGHSVTCIGDRRLVAKQGAPPQIAKTPLEFLPDERERGLRGSLLKYLAREIRARDRQMSPFRGC